MELRFDFDRSLQAAAYLLHLEEGRMPYIRLLRLLYVAERELLAEAAMPLTGDLYKAMPQGPILGHVHDLIRGNGARSIEWERCIRRAGYSVKLVEDPGRGKLPGVVLDKLGEVSARYSETGQWEASDLARDFPEWARNRPGEGLITVEEILEAQGVGSDVLEVIQEAEATREHMAKLFGPRRPGKAAGHAEPAR
jgi:uncharacterized phage-associated protein